MFERTVTGWVNAKDFDSELSDIASGVAARFCVYPTQSRAMDAAMFRGDRQVRVVATFAWDDSTGVPQ